MEQTKIQTCSMAEEIEQEAMELHPSLPKAMEGTFLEVSLYNGIWYPTGMSPLSTLLTFQKCFQAHDQDIIVVSAPKCGTTWLKALTFSIVNRSRFTPSNTPLLTTNPHLLFPYIDIHPYLDKDVPDLNSIPPPRLLSTHLPYSALPESITRSKCLLVYICRNPFDSALSLWYHYREMSTDFKIPLEEFFELQYFEGVTMFGPYWDNVLGYWKESLERPDKVLFLKYEDMKEDTISCLKRIAEFIGYPFSNEEESGGVVEEISKLCSFKTLQNLEVNKEGRLMKVFPNKVFFRKGDVGDGVHVLSPDLKQKLQNVMEEKLRGSGLSFKLSI